MKGGHLRTSETSTDILFDGDRFLEFTSPRIDTGNDHGGGDTLAAAIACALAHGYSVPEAVAFGKEWVTRCLAASYDLGAGHGPVSPFWRLNQSDDLEVLGDTAELGREEPTPIRPGGQP